MNNETKEIKKVSIGAVSIKKAKSDGTPYSWMDKKTNTRKNRTMVSIKVDEVWYMGWSYKDGSAAENLKNGDVVELLLITEVAEDGKVWQSWKFPKEEDKQAIENAELKRKLAAFEAAQGAQGTQSSPVPYVPNTPVNTMPSALGGASLTANPSAQTEPEF